MPQAGDLAQHPKVDLLLLQAVLPYGGTSHGKFKIPPRRGCNQPYRNSLATWALGSQQVADGGMVHAGGDLALQGVPGLVGSVFLPGPPQGTGLLVLKKVM